MPNIATYVFLDLETTGLPKEENNKTKIIEISLVAVKRDHFLETMPGATPRVQHKLTLCLNPGRLVNPGCTEVTGLCNDLLEHEPDFNLKVVNIVNNFLDVLTKPVCLIAQNGLNFDFPIIKRQYEKLKVDFDSDILCADCYHAFYDILEERKKDVKVEVQEVSHIDQTVPKKITSEEKNHGDNIASFYELENMLSMQKQNEKTPKAPRQIIPHVEQKISKGVCKARRRMPWMNAQKPKESYKLKSIYNRLLNRPPLEAHRAENDCIMALECCVTLGEEFINWVDNNHIPISEIKPMTYGVPLGQ